MADTDPYGFFSDVEPEPRKKRVRSKRPQARDVEAPVAADDEEPEGSDPDPYGFFANETDTATAPDADLSRGPPPGPAGKPTSEGQRGGALRTEEPAWYESLLESGASFYQGLTQNTLDETAAGYAWALDKLGVTNSGRTFAENQKRAHDILGRATSDYPVGHGAGQAVAGMAAGAVAPGAGALGVAAQGLTQGALSAGAEYADSRDPVRTAKAGGIGLATGMAGAWLGNRAAAKLGVVDPMRNDLVRGGMTPAQMRGAPSPDITARGGRALDFVEELAPVDPLKGKVVRGAMSEADMTGAPASNITARGAAPRRAVQELESVDPLEASIVRGPVSPEEGAALGYQQPAPQAAPPRAPATRQPFDARGQLSLNRPTEDVVPGRRLWSEADALDVPPPEPAASRWGPVEPRRAPADPDLSPLELPPSSPQMEATLSARRPTSRAVEPLDLDSPPRWDVASSAQVAAAKPPIGASLDRVLGAAQHVPGLGIPARAGRAGLRLLGPDVAAREAGVYLNDRARQVARGGFEAAWELGAPGVTGSKVNAQDAEPVAYADQATMNYALSETLSSGRTGLSPEDEQTLTSAVVRGDDDAIRAADFRMRQKYPAYARKVERALRGLNEED